MTNSPHLYATRLCARGFRLSIGQQLSLIEGIRWSVAQNAVIKSRGIKNIVVALGMSLGGVGGVVLSESVAYGQGQSSSCDAIATEQYGTVPATMVRTSAGQEFPLIYWISDYLSPEVFAQDECETAALTLQDALEDGDTLFIKTFVVDGNDVLCLVDDADDRCRRSNILVSLAPSVDRYDAIADLLDTAQLSNLTPLYFTDDLVTYVDRETVVSLDAMFEIVDETGYSSPPAAAHPNSTRPPHSPDDTSSDSPDRATDEN